VVAAEDIAGGAAGVRRDAEGSDVEVPAHRAPGGIARLFGKGRYDLGHVRDTVGAAAMRNLRCSFANSIRPLYQYVDQSPPSCVETSGAGSA
jgi:hypothetical protein